jgi:hypothetical protein
VGEIYLEMGTAPSSTSYYFFNGQRVAMRKNGVERSLA